MSLRESLQQEIHDDLDRTRRTLERVPAASLSWAPHPRSMTLGRLATHLAEMPANALRFLRATDIDMAPAPDAPRRVANVLGSPEEINELFAANHAALEAALETTTDEDLSSTFTLRVGDQVLVRKPKADALRVLFVQHTCHHRGQLTVYLRLLDVPLPALFGPSGDERPT
jgi:uncharacterized damage-inducible protein DinB